MKKYFVIFIGILASTLIFTGCNSYAQSGYRGGYYDPNYAYGYGDGQPGNDYYYNNNQPIPNNMGQPAGQMPVGFNDFYNQLSPYGSWVNIAPYGQVWIANVPNFQPYSTNGYWTYTNYGWTWVSNYSWGWAPFHYGRWGYNNRYGWYWVPGYVWGPAWVAWSSSSDMYGWAPLMPGMNFNVSLSLNSFPSTYWTFMQGRYMGMPNIGNYYVNRSKNVTIIKNTTIINNYGTENNRRYTMGPSANDVQRYYTDGRTVQQMRVTNVSDRMNTGVAGNNELRVYRPITSPANAPSNNRVASTNASDNNRAVAPQTQTRTQQPAQQSTTNRGSAVTPQTRSAQSKTQEDVYRQNSAQPKVKNSAAPQTSRQIQAAQNDNKKVEQQRSATQERTNSTSNSGRR